MYEMVCTFMSGFFLIIIRLNALIDYDMINLEMIIRSEGLQERDKELGKKWCGCLMAGKG